MLPHKRHLVPVVFCLLLFNACRPGIKNSPETVENSPVISENAVNINTASAEELEKLPHVGKETARKIIEHRERYGNFRRAEHLILVEGISDKKFREMRNFIKIK
jgi:competence ComEA-like helix-hairpin-helix protein